jgi:hypothetical protein
MGVSASSIIINVISIVIVASVIGTTNAQSVGSLTYTVLQFVTVGLAVVLIAQVFGNKSQ